MVHFHDHHHNSNACRNRLSQCDMVCITQSVIEFFKILLAIIPFGYTKKKKHFPNEMEAVYFYLLNTCFYISLSGFFVKLNLCIPFNQFNIFLMSQINQAKFYDKKVFVIIVCACMNIIYCISKNALILRTILN